MNEGMMVLWRLLTIMLCFIASDLTKTISELHLELNSAAPLRILPGTKTFSDELSRQVQAYGPVASLQYTITAKSQDSWPKHACNDLRTSIWVGVNLPSTDSANSKALLTVVRMDNILGAGEPSSSFRCVKEQLFSNVSGWPEELTIHLQPYDVHVQLPPSPDHDCYQELIDLPGAVALPRRRSIKVPRHVIVVTHNEHGKPFPIADKVLAVNKMHNPGYQFWQYTVADLPELIELYLGAETRRLVETVQAIAFRVDVFRYMMLHRFGGVYIDSKVWALQPLEQMLPDAEQPDMFVWDVDRKGIHNTFLAVCKGDPLMEAGLKRALDNIRSRYYGDSALEITGPKALKLSYDALPPDVAQRYDGWLKSNGFHIIDKDGRPWIIPHNAEYVRFMRTHQSCLYALLWKRRSIYYERPCADILRESMPRKK